MTYTQGDPKVTNTRLWRHDQQGLATSTAMPPSTVGEALCALRSQSAETREMLANSASIALA